MVVLSPESKTVGRNPRPLLPEALAKTEQLIITAAVQCFGTMCWSPWPLCLGCFSLNGLELLFKLFSCQFSIIFYSHIPLQIFQDEREICRSDKLKWLQVPSPWRHSDPKIASCVRYNWAPGRRFLDVQHVALWADMAAVHKSLISAGPATHSTLVFGPIRNASLKRLDVVCQEILEDP